MSFDFKSFAESAKLGVRRDHLQFHAPTRDIPMCVADPVEHGKASILMDGILYRVDPFARRNLYLSLKVDLDAIDLTCKLVFFNGPTIRDYYRKARKVIIAVWHYVKPDVPPRPTR